MPGARREGQELPTTQPVPSIETMRTTTRQTTSRRTRRRPIHLASPRTGRSAEQRVRDEGGPQDVAFYRCGCGCAFDGAVSTHVACPHCGTEQAW